MENGGTNISKHFPCEKAESFFPLSAATWPSERRAAAQRASSTACTALSSRLPPPAPAAALMAVRQRRKALTAAQSFQESRSVALRPLRWTFFPGLRKNGLPKHWKEIIFWSILSGKYTCRKEWTSEDVENGTFTELSKCTVEMCQTTHRKSRRNLRFLLIKSLCEVWLFSQRIYP